MLWTRCFVIDMKELLSIENLTVAAGSKLLVDQVSFDVPKGKIVAIAGGSGSGKTTIGLSILRLLASPLSIRQGSIFFEGRNLLELSDEEIRRCRGARIGVVFQEPLSAFDPLFTIGRQLDETLVAHTKMSKQERYKKILGILSEVELSNPQRAYESYPHQLSGGMRQRAMVAQAMVCGPSLIIADEPTSSLDVTLQVKIAGILDSLKKKDVSVLLISHDLGMISHVADEVIILCQGKMVEQGPARQVIDSPRHEYTRQLVLATM
ncbi:MAG: ABC transporter ATP-binding protein [Candidatus Omnitrophica bacterium]|nr:ABC transporter ATP-binding protein [Candidatus Omnitrophota bacterium]